MPYPYVTSQWIANISHLERAGRQHWKSAEVLPSQLQTLQENQTEIIIYTPQCHCVGYCTETMIGFDEDLAAPQNSILDLSIKEPRASLFGKHPIARPKGSFLGIGLVAIYFAQTFGLSSLIDTFLNQINKIRGG